MPIFNENVYDLLILFKAVESTPPADFPAEGQHNPWHSVVVSRHGGLIPNMENTNGVGLPPRPSIRQTADYFGVDQKTIRRWIAQGRLTANRLGPCLIRLDRAEVLQLGRPVGAA
jgi:excisionase family DNA binding protein